MKDFLDSWAGSLPGMRSRKYAVAPAREITQETEEAGISRVISDFNRFSRARRVIIHRVLPKRATGVDCVWPAG